MILNIEIHDALEVRVGGSCKNEGIGAVDAKLVVIAPQFVVAAAAIDDVITASARDVVVLCVASQGIRMRAAEHALDRRKLITFRIPFGLRLKSFTPMSVSSLLIASVTAGCDVNKAAAAFDTCPVSATATKKRK